MSFRLTTRTASSATRSSRTSASVSASPPMSLVVVLISSESTWLSTTICPLMPIPTFTESVVRVVSARRAWPFPSSRRTRTKKFSRTLRSASKLLCRKSGRGRSIVQVCTDNDDTGNSPRKAWMLLRTWHLKGVRRLREPCRVTRVHSGDLICQRGLPRRYPHLGLEDRRCRPPEREIFTKLEPGLARFVCGLL
jgi:hypothetical protein